MESVVLSVSEFVDFCNQSLEIAYPSVRIQGEVSEFRISKSKWLYFKLQDEHSSVQFFGSVYQLQHPIEDGMLVEVMGVPRLHNKYGFSINIRSLKPSGEGTIKRAFELLKAKLDKEGLFDATRKRPIPEVPKRIGLITSDQAAAYGDFMEILNQRWGDVEVLMANVQVQGDPAPGMIVGAINYFNELSEPVDVLVITRGGGSAEDLQAFSTESVARAIAGSRTPTVVGVGHEVDVSLADLVADVRATTPTNAAQIVVPDKAEVLQQIGVMQIRMTQAMQHSLSMRRQFIQQSVSDLQYKAARPMQRLQAMKDSLVQQMDRRLEQLQTSTHRQQRVLTMIDPNRVLRRGYSLLKTSDGRVITDSTQVVKGQDVVITLHKGTIEAEVTNGK